MLIDFIKATKKKNLGKIDFEFLRQETIKNRIIKSGGPYWIRTSDFHVVDVTL